MSASTTYYLYFSEKQTQVFSKRLNDIALVNFTYQNQPLTVIENSVYFDFTRKDIALNPRVPFSMLNHQNVFHEKVMFAGYQYRLDETLEVLVQFILNHGLSLQKNDKIAVIYGFGQEFIDSHKETMDMTINYMLHRYQVVIEGFYQETHLLKMGFELLSLYTQKAWLYLQDTSIMYERYIAPRNYFSLTPAYTSESLQSFYQDLQKRSMIRSNRKPISVKYMWSIHLDHID